MFFNLLLDLNILKRGLSAITPIYKNLYFGHLSTHSSFIVTYIKCHNKKSGLEAEVLFNIFSICVFDFWYGKTILKFSPFRD